MQKNRCKVIIWVIVLIVLVAVIALIYFVSAKSSSKHLIGGDRDEHGCIGSAGYSWCQSKDKCLRTWEEPCL